MTIAPVTQLSQRSTQQRSQRPSQQRSQRPSQQHSQQHVQRFSRCFLQRVARVMIATGGIFLVGCGNSTAPTEAVSTYTATIVKTNYGIPHITANSWGSLGFGEAYSAAEDHVCNIALALVQSRGESAAAFGPGRNNRNTTRDIVVKALGIPERAKAALEAQEPDIREWIEGYTAGYNQFLQEKAGNHGSWCNGEDWVRPVTTIEVMAQYVTLVYTLPRISGALVAAQPPRATTPKEDQLATAINAAPTVDATLSNMKLRDMGSNAWAIAAKRSENGRGLLLANPHYPWYGIARFWEKHLTIPGKYNAYGAGLIGAPGVAVGFNQNLGWSHTVSNSKRTVIYQLSLNPNDPTQYRWQDGWRSLTNVAVSVDVKTDAGIVTKPHTIWSSHHGPLLVLPGLSDDPLTAYAVRDANQDNIHTFAQWKAMGSARNMDDFVDAHRTYNAMPWVNTIAASADGRAVYIDNSNVGALSTEAIERWRKTLKVVPKLQYLFLSKGLVILDGSSAANDWLETTSPVPNTEPFEQRPLIESEQYVFNANDSYWLSDPERPAESVSPLYGATMTPRSVRTRMNIELLKPNSAFGYAGSDNKFNRTEIQDALFGNDSLSAHLLLPEVLAACQNAPERDVAGKIIDLTAACAVLKGWDRKFNRESRGAVLFREWLTRYPYDETYLGKSLFNVAFNPMEPADTPRGLADESLALDRLAEAVDLLNTAGIALDVPLGELQVAHRAERDYPIHGGNGYDGIANIQGTTTRTSNPTETPIFTGSEHFVGDSKSLSTSGYNVVHGSSFIMALAWGEAGPEAEAILSYSQSGDPTSPHFDDQTKLYADKQWRPIIFNEDEIEKGAISQRVLKSGF